MAKKQKCLIIGAVPIESKELFKALNLEEFFIICADAGYINAEKNAVIPDLIVGDFDSSSKPQNTTAKVISLPVEKDLTDTMYAVQMGIEQGKNDFILLGCLGGERLDHTFANLEVLHFLLINHAKAELLSETERIFLLEEGKAIFNDRIGDTLSLFPYAGDSCTVSYKGLQYPLDHHKLTIGGDIMGVSNTIVEEEIEIEVHQGEALVFIKRV